MLSAAMLSAGTDDFAVSWHGNALTVFASDMLVT